MLVVLAAVIWAVLLPRHDAGSPDAQYLSALKDSGLADGFNSDANAVAHGRQVCKQLDDGGPQQGVAADKFAVDAFCPRFSEGFHVLETANASGTFVLIDTSKEYVSSIESDRDKCHGVHGYSDIGSGTQVMVKNGKGEILASAPLGEGHGDDVNCRFAFTSRSPRGRTATCYRSAIAASSATASNSCSEAVSRFTSASSAALARDRRRRRRQSSLCSSGMR